MLLTKSRFSVATIAIISILLALALFRVADRASADNAAGVLPGMFGDTTNGTLLLGWDWKAQDSNMALYLFLDPTWPGNPVSSAEVFVTPAAGEAPITTQFLGNFGPFPTARTLCFVFTTTKPAPPGTLVGIHLRNSTNAVTVISPSPINQGLINYAAPCVEAESADPTPTPTKRPATPTAKPPVSGDFTPGSGMLMALLLAGFVLITAGGTYLLQTRPSGVRN